jgi:hypothetical protein
MSQAAPRRSALVISVDSTRAIELKESSGFAEAPLMALPAAGTRADEVAHALSSLGYEVSRLRDPTGRDLRDAAETAMGSSDYGDHLIIYMIGHTRLADDGSSLVIMGSDGDPMGGVDARVWLDRAGDIPGRVLFLLDMNHARLAARAIEGRSGRHAWLVGAPDGKALVEPGRLSQALAAALRGIAAGGELAGRSQYVPFEAFVSAVRERLRLLHDGRSEQLVAAGEADPAHEYEFSFFPNPRWAAPSPTEAPSPAAAADGPLAGGISADWVDPNDSIPLDRDQLSVGVYASMLAGVIANRDTPMPLSIGLFGNWGSGKSYFMGLLRGEVERLADAGPPAYLPDIVQISFNAWHYTDTNLWASLGDEIFRQLAGPTEDAGSRRAALRADLLKLLEYRRILATRAKQAKQETIDLRAQLDRASADHEATALDLVRAVAGSAEFRARLARVWAQLGITDQAEQANALARELNGAGGDIKAARQLLSGRWARVTTFGFVAGLGLLAIAPLIPAATAWLGRGGLAAVAGSLAAAVTIVARFRTGLAGLTKLATDVRNRAKEAVVAEDLEKVRPLLERLRGAEAAQAVAQAQLDEVANRVGELSRQLNDLAPGQRLYSFITERASGDLYTRHLGLISTIRKDFQNLVELMGDWRSREDQADTARRPIDRIVLYIDDLDRCSPRQVVDVLQAVHLLLALDLFVVVVGVDPRWLLDSLRRHYDGILGRDSDDGPDHVAIRAMMPEDYLEKIFNIPVVLPGMPPGSLDGLFRSLTNRTDLAAYWHRPDGAGEAPARTATGADQPTDTTTTAVDQARITVQPGSELAADGPATEPASMRPLTEPELKLLGELEPLVDSPRDATRLLNLYRMLRSTRDLADASTFLGDPGEYQAVIVLLGLLTAHARLLAVILDTAPSPKDGIVGGLASRPSGQTWRTFVADLAPRQSEDGGWVNRVCGPLSAEDLPDWRRLHAGAACSARQVTLPDLSAFHEWAPRIRRFSFALSPLSPGVDSGTPGRPDPAVTTGDGAPDGSQPRAAPRPRRRTSPSR